MAIKCKSFGHPKVVTFVYFYICTITKKNHRFYVVKQATDYSQQPGIIFFYNGNQEHILAQQPGTKHGAQQPGVMITFFEKFLFFYFFSLNDTIFYKCVIHMYIPCRFIATYSCKCLASFVIFSLRIPYKYERVTHKIWKGLPQYLTGDLK